jgi:hypothetical protein
MTVPHPSPECRLSNKLAVHWNFVNDVFWLTAEVQLQDGNVWKGLGSRHRTWYGVLGAERDALGTQDAGVRDKVSGLLGEGSKE